MKKLSVLLLCLLAAVFPSCKDDGSDGPEFRFSLPEATDITATTANVSCRAGYDLAQFAGLAKGFVYGRADDLTEQCWTVTDVVTDGRAISARLTDLAPGVRYWVYAFASLGASSFESEPVEFTTRAAAEPAFDAPSHTAVTAGGATLSCSFTYAGDETISKVYFAYRATGGAVQRADVSASAGAKSASLTGLSASTTYTYRLAVEVGGRTFSSVDGSFTTASGGSQPGKTLRSGWAELPTSAEKPGDWYYTYHMTDVDTPKGTKARNYSVCYSREKMCAIWVAAPMHRFYSEKNVNRTDAYKSDPTLSFTQPGKWTGYTRGHMLGSAERLVSRTTNQQVFYYTNIAPQLQTYFNMSGGAWNTLEDWVDKQWASSSDTTYQVIGSYWDPNGRPEVVSGTTVPTHYYKVLLRTKGHTNKWVQECTRDELQCIAILVEHRAYSKAEVPKPAQYESKGMIYTVEELERLTGVTFFGNVPNAPKETCNPSDWGL